MEKQKINVSILAKDFSITTDEDKQKVIAAAEKVENMIKHLLEHMPNLHESHAALMVCLQLAVDGENLRERLQSFQLTAHTITAKIDQVLASQ